ncbi:MAG: NAD(P)-binding protein, partial [Candidatus Thermoplasmatota archaeon]|nr:NAD(P)-binding protein [Candidatus Thermoplasmatota archaeon]
MLIVGAGPAGSTTARYCAGKDLDVLLIDRRSEIGYP